MLHQSRRFINLLGLALLLILTISISFHIDSAINQDLGRHLLLGRLIWEKKTIPRTNLFSYTYKDFPFINHHWGSEVIFFLVHNTFSINGLIILKVILILISVGILCWFAVKRSDFVFFLLSSFLTLEILRDRTDIRPEIFAFLLFSFFLVILYREREKKDNLVFFLPLILLIWVNLHISFIFGLSIYLFFLLDRLLTKSLARNYFIVGLLLLAAILANPFGVTGAVYPLTIFNNYGYSVVENQSPFFLEKLMNYPAIFYYKISLLLLICVAPLLFVRRYFYELSIVFLTGILSFRVVRHFPFFALSLLFPLSLGLTMLGQKIQIKRMKLVLGVLLMVFFSWESFNLLTNKYYQKHYSETRTGLGMVKGLRDSVDFFLSNNLRDPIFNNFDIGSYLLYRLYPEYLVFVDGRPEAYPTFFFQDVYIPMQENEEIWRKINKKYNFQTIIFGHTDATPWGRKYLARIAQDKDWVIVYFDDYGVIFTRRDGLLETLEVLDTVDKLKSQGLTFIKHSEDSSELMRLGNFFNLVGIPELGSLARLKAKRLSG